MGQSPPLKCKSPENVDVDYWWINKLPKDDGYIYLDSLAIGHKQKLDRGLLALSNELINFYADYNWAFAGALLVCVPYHTIIHHPHLCRYLFLHL
jgi:hypothetical protein